MCEKLVVIFNIMKRLPPDASTYTDYIRKKINTSFIQSQTGKYNTSIVSSIPSVTDILSPSLQSYFEGTIIKNTTPEPIVPPEPSIVTIVDDILANDENEGILYLIGVTSITVSWECTPLSSVKLELYASPAGTGSYSVVQTINTSSTSYTFDLPSVVPTFSDIYIVITPSIGDAVTGRVVRVVY